MSTKLSPPTLADRLWAGELPYELALAAGGAITGGVAGYRCLAAAEPEYWPAAGYIGAALLVTGVLVWRGVVRNYKAQGHTERHALDGALHTLYSILTVNQSPEFKDHGLRICVFVPVCETCDEVHQLTDYVCDAQSYGSGRNMSSRCGVVGQAFRQGKAIYGKLPKGVPLTDHLVATYGFDRSEAAAMREDRKSWAGIPIGAPGRIIAVLFLDSKEREFFGNNGQSRRREIEAAIVGVAKFLART